MATHKIFSPFRIGSKTVENRIALAPMTRGRASEDGITNNNHEIYYSQRSNAGIVITEGTFISKQGTGWVKAPGIYSKAQTESWKKVVQTVNKNSTSSFWVQLWHTGRASHSDFHEGSLPVAPSAIPITGSLAHTPLGKKPYEVPHSLSVDEIQVVIQDFKNAALNAKEAGFDGIEIHAANGYLLDSFLQSKTNTRTDAYGGSFENRFRILNQVIESVSDVFSNEQIAVRLSPNGVYNDMGSKDFRESFLYYIQELSKKNLGYLHVMDGLAFGFHEIGDPMTLKEIRNIYPGTIMGNCGYDIEKAKEAVESNNADIVSFGRPFISNPDLVTRFKNQWPLAPDAPVSVWYSAGPEGYIDFPVYSPEVVA